MTSLSLSTSDSEQEFARQVDSLVGPTHAEFLVELLGESNPVYDQRGTSAVIRMRGWVLLALSRVGVSDRSLVFVLEELDTGLDPYLVAAAALALRSYPERTAGFAPFLIRALANIRYRDEPICFDSYGAYASASTTNTSPLQEIFASLAWLGSYASGVLPELEKLQREAVLSVKRTGDLDQAILAIRAVGPRSADECCDLSIQIGRWARIGFPPRANPDVVAATEFEDQDGQLSTFRELFYGHPSIVVFFYTRCDNPLKCSLTITKLARVQQLLSERGLAEQIHTAAITYDPGFDLPYRLSAYGQNRSASTDARNRFLRETSPSDTLRQHFGLGVNFIESLVNRHKVEAFVLDRGGKVACSFERILWNETELVDRAADLLREASKPANASALATYSTSSTHDKGTPPALATLASLAFAFFPKCAMCWAAYLSAFGIAGLNQLPYSPWLLPVFGAIMLLNLASVWVRTRSSQRILPFYLVSAGLLTITFSVLDGRFQRLAALGVILTFAGSVLSALRHSTQGPREGSGLLV